MKFPSKSVPRWGLATVIVLGFLARAAWVIHDRTAPAHPDLLSFHPDHLPLTHPFDTSPREPLFVWWLWSLQSLGIKSVFAIRLEGILWFLPNAFLMFHLIRRHWNERIAWGALTLFAFLPGQIMADGVGLRHLLETTGVLLFLSGLSNDSGLSTGKSFGQAAIGFAGLVLTRITYAGAGGALLVLSAVRGRRWRPLLAGLPAAFLLFFHLANNHRRYGDALYSVNRHSYWFANREFVGRPGYPATEEERQINNYQKTATYRQWAFKEHSPKEFMRDTGIGYVRAAWTFYSWVYFRIGLPGWMTIFLLALHLWGGVFGLTGPAGRVVIALWVVFIYPFAFPSHVYWVGRFFVPFTPLTLGLLASGLDHLGLKARSGWLRLRS